jgi:Stress responsive A/B Barrel Domain
MKSLLVMILVTVMLGSLALSAAEKPNTVIHVVTLKWKDGVTDAQIKQALTTLEKVAASYPGITRLWLRSVKVQGAPIGECAACKQPTHAFVMEFANEAALTKYAGSDAQKEFYKVYLPLRDESRTHDITN